MVSPRIPWCTCLQKKKKKKKSFQVAALKGMCLLNAVLWVWGSESWSLQDQSGGGLPWSNFSLWSLAGIMQPRSRVTLCRRNTVWGPVHKEEVQPSWVSLPQPQVYASHLLTLWLELLKWASLAAREAGKQRGTWRVLSSAYPAILHVSAQ